MEVTHEAVIREALERNGLAAKLPPEELEATVRREVALAEARTGSATVDLSPSPDQELGRVEWRRAEGAPRAVPAFEVSPELADRIANTPPPPPPEYECAICEDARALRVTADRDDPAFGSVVECVCVPLEDRARRAGIPARYARALETSDPSIAGKAEAWDAAAEWFLGGNGAALVLCSAQTGARWGTGKTHLAAVLALMRLAQGKPARFLYVADFLAEIRRRFASNGGPAGAAEQYIERVAAEPFLVLDDLGAEHGTEWASVQIRSLIDARYRSSVRTVYTTNARRPAELAEQFGGAVGSRLLEADWIAVGGVDMRAQRA